MSKLDKLRQILAIAGPVGKLAVPGIGASVIDIVTEGLAQHPSPASGASQEAITLLVEAIVELRGEVKFLTERVAQLEVK